MPVHVAAFVENQDGAGTLQNLAALSDPLTQEIQINNTDFMRVHAKLPFIAGVQLQLDHTVEPRARLVAPSFRTMYGRVGIELPFIGSGPEPDGTNPLFNDYRFNPIKLEAGENLSLETVNNPGAADFQYGVVWFSSGKIAPVDPDGGYWARFTTTAAALTANTFGSRALTADEDLTAKRYACLGARVVSTSLVTSRLQFPDQSFRPGVMGVDARADRTHPAFQPGAWGVLGEFTPTNLPAIEPLVDAADNESQIVDLYIKKLA